MTVVPIDGYIKVGSCFCTHCIDVDSIGFAMNNIFVDAILNVLVVVGRVIQPLIVGFIIAK